MKKQKITSYEYVLEGDERDTILTSLRYVRHRQDMHGKRLVNEQELERLINELE